MFDSANANVVINELAAVERSLLVKQGELRGVSDTVGKLKAAVEDMKVQSTVKNMTNMVLKRGVERGSESKVKVEELLSYGMSAVFEEDIEVRFEIEVRGKGKLVVTPRLKTKDGDLIVETGVLGGRGGGKVNVFCFLMRVIALLSIRPKLRPILVLDESFGNVSQAYLENVGMLLLEFAKRMNGQILLVTHKDVLGAMGTTYRITKENGESRVALIRREDGSQ